MINKKYIATILVFVLSVTSLIGYHKLENIHAADTLSKSAIRFHVLANSDSTKDQSLKMKVKENVVDYIYKNTKNCDSVVDTKSFILKNDTTIKSIALDTIRKNGYDYSVTSFFGKQNFPEKIYGDIVFPEGNYTSYTLTIGNGKGHNWWCVLYPPLCFVDASTGIVPDSSKEILKESMDENEYKSIVKYKFKYLTFLNGLFN